MRFSRQDAPPQSGDRVVGAGRHVLLALASGEGPARSLVRTPTGGVSERVTRLFAEGPFSLPEGKEIGLIGSRGIGIPNPNIRELK